MNTTVKTPIGNVTVKANPEAMKEMEDDIDMKIVKSTVVKTRENCLKLLNVDIDDSLAIWKAGRNALDQLDGQMRLNMDGTLTEERICGKKRQSTKSS